MRNQPPLASLRAFEAAARRLSFKAAADELHVTATAISHQIRVLESYCGEALFQRLPRPLSLTPAGTRLYPAVREGFDRFAEGLSQTKAKNFGRLRVTATNAFAARCLMPRIPAWRQLANDITLMIIGTDDVLDLGADASDLAIRYARKAPVDGVVSDLGRDTFHVVASPDLVEQLGLPVRPQDIARYPLIESEWPDWAEAPPMWREWAATARNTGHEVPDLMQSVVCGYREELHAIEAALAGQGLAICSDILVADALRDGKLVKVSDVTMPGFGLFTVYRRESTRATMCRTFVNWLGDQEWH